MASFHVDEVGFEYGKKPAEFVIPTITVVGLGPAGPELITTQVNELLQSAPTVWLRTRRHPAASIVPDAFSFDEVYNQASTIEAVYFDIVEQLVHEASLDGSVVYAVPGSPLVAEATVELLRADKRVDVRVVPSLSFLDLAWERLGVDPLTAGPRIIDAHRFATEAAGERGPLLVSQCEDRWVLSAIKLTFEDDPPPEVVVLQRLGLPDEKVFTIAWDDLDRAIEPDHLTSLWVSTVAVPVARELARINELALRLRRDCPWDREQTHASLSRHLIEETYELLEVIDLHASGMDSELTAGESMSDVDLIEELGDLFFQIFAHAAIAAEEGRFNIADVARQVTDKLIERHPHVFGEVTAETSDEVMASWEANKKASKGRSSLMDGIPRHLPALLYASKVLKKAATTGIELSEDDIESTGYGGVLLLLTDQARRDNVDLEEALRLVVSHFQRRFEEAEKLAAVDGIELATVDHASANRYWDKANSLKL